MTRQASEIIDEFFGDTDVQRLVASTATWEPLQICYPKEVNVSRLIAWLLDPTQGHGLGDLPIQSLLSRAWRNADDSLPLATRRFLSPSNVYTESFSSVVVTTEVELNGKSLDVLLIDTNRRRYIAIENKFGARESDAQLRNYRKGLEKLFPEFLGVHVFLDSNEAEPSDPAWIPVGYDWLADFLREAGQREATAVHVRQTLDQFRSVIEDVAEDAASTGPYGKLVIEVSSRHPEAIEVMKPWQGAAKASRAQVLAALLDDAATLDGKAALRLFQLYWRRKAVWDHCIRQAQFAPFVRGLRDAFADLEVDPKRVRTGFSLARWKALVDVPEDEGYFYPAGVNIRKTGETFQVVSYVNVNDVGGDARDRLVEIAINTRSRHGIRGAVRDQQHFIVIRRARDLTMTRALEQAREDLSSLAKGIADALPGLVGNPSSAR